MFCSTAPDYQFHHNRNNSNETQKWHRNYAVHRNCPSYVSPSTCYQRTRYTWIIQSKTTWGGEKAPHKAWWEVSLSCNRICCVSVCKQSWRWAVCSGILPGKEPDIRCCCCWLAALFGPMPQIQHFLFPQIQGVVLWCLTSFKLCRTVTCQTGDRTQEFPSDTWMNLWGLKQMFIRTEVEHVLRLFR